VPEQAPICSRSARRTGLPVAASFRCQDYVDNASPVYAGHLTLGGDPRLAARVREADLLLVVGARLGEITTLGYTLVEAPRPTQNPHPRPLGRRGARRVYDTELAIVSGLEAFATAISTLAPLDSTAWQGESAQAHADYVDSLRHNGPARRSRHGRRHGAPRERLPADTIVTNGAGNFSVWAHRFWEFRGFRSQLAPTSGAMGYGVPALSRRSSSAAASRRRVRR